MQSFRFSQNINRVYEYVLLYMTNRNRIYQYGKIFTYSDVQPGLCNQKFFRDEALYQQLVQKPTIIQLKIEGQIKFINLFLLQYDAHVIILQGTHYLSAQKLLLQVLNYLSLF